MRKTNRLEVTVLDENGNLLEEGGVSLTGVEFRAGMHIENGVGEREVPVDEITISVGRVFLEDDAPRSVTTKLLPGVVNEVRIRLEK